MKEKVFVTYRKHEENYEKEFDLNYFGAQIDQLVLDEVIKIEDPNEIGLLLDPLGLSPKDMSIGIAKKLGISMIIYKVKNHHYTIF